jgi:hypothetical protein
MRIRVAFASLVAVVSLAFFASSALAVDKDCSDFHSWREAQHYFKKHGGPRHDPDRLDGDHDGIACEDLR